MPVDSFVPNPWGLYQVHGNVQEWCEDRWHDSYEEKPEDLKAAGAAWTTGDSHLRVLRGGSWYFSPLNICSAVRNRHFTEKRYNDTGFRVARTLTP